MGEQSARRVRPPDDLPRSPSGRVPKWVVYEAQGRRSPDAVPWRASADLTPPRGRHGRTGRRSRGRWQGQWVSWASVIVIVGSLLGWAFTHGGLSPMRPVNVRLANAPTPGRDEANHPFAHPPVVTARSSSYRFIAHQADGKSPVAYDPCRPVHYVVREKGTPAFGHALLSEAFARVSQATGLQFRDDGTTSEDPSAQREPFQKARYGNRWAPVLIAWETSQENADFAADVAGEAGSQRVSLPGHPAVYVSGQVELDTAKVSAMLARPGGRGLARALIGHELGHLVGLAHVTDPTQVMYPQVQRRVADFGLGDLAGLAALGQGLCAPWL